MVYAAGPAKTLSYWGSLWPTPVKRLGGQARTGVWAVGVGYGCQAPPGLSRNWFIWRHMTLAHCFLCLAPSGVSPLMIAGTPLLKQVVERLTNTDPSPSRPGSPSSNPWFWSEFFPRGFKDPRQPFASHPCRLHPLTKRLSSSTVPAHPLQPSAFLRSCLQPSRLPISGYRFGIILSRTTSCRVISAFCTRSWRMSHRTCQRSAPRSCSG